MFFKSLVVLESQVPGHWQPLMKRFVALFISTWFLHFFCFELSLGRSVCSSNGLVPVEIIDLAFRIP